MECITCDGHGTYQGKPCEFCKGRGRIEIVGCPYDEIRGMLGLIDMFDLFDHGAMPIAGGVLNQSAWFINARNHWKRENARVKADG